jgi:hypothetical protein
MGEPERLNREIIYLQCECLSGEDCMYSGSREESEMTVLAVIARG